MNKTLKYKDYIVNIKYNNIDIYLEFKKDEKNISNYIIYSNKITNKFLTNEIKIIKNLDELYNLILSVLLFKKCFKKLKKSKKIYSKLKISINKEENMLLYFNIKINNILLLNIQFNIVLYKETIIKLPLLSSMKNIISYNTDTKSEYFDNKFNKFNNFNKFNKFDDELEKIQIEYN